MSVHLFCPAFKIETMNYLLVCCVVGVVMDKDDMLSTFEDHIRRLEQEEEEKKMKDREYEKRSYRKNRDSFLVSVMIKMLR